MLPMGISYLRQSGDHASSYAIGRALGTGMLIAVVAAVLQALHRRFTYRVEPAPLQAFIAIVAVLAIGGQYVLRSRDEGADIDRILAAAHQCQAADTAPFGSPPAGLSLVDISAQERQVFAQQAASAMPEGLSADLYVINRIVDGGSIRGAAIAFPGVGSFPDQLGEFGAGAIASAGGTPTGTAGPGGRVTLGEGPGTAIAAGANGCWGVVVMSSSRSEAVTFSDALLTG